MHVLMQVYAFDSYYENIYSITFVIKKEKSHLLNMMKPKRYLICNLEVKSVENKIS